MSPSARHAYEWGWLSARDGGEPPADYSPEAVAGWNDRRAGVYRHPDGTVIPAAERDKRIHADREGKCTACGQREATQNVQNVATGEIHRTCAVCAQKLAEMHPVPTPDPASPAPAGDAPPAPAGGTAPQGEPTPGLARVIPITSTSTKEEPQMSETNTSEITGLVSAQAYAAAMAESFNTSAASVEEFTASLTGFDVSGEAIAAAEHAQEMQQAAAAAWEQAQAALAKQDQVKEAYEAVPEAGSKEFVTSE